ncbi:MAG: hypothetical protein ACK5KR_03525 [Breznakia sp.]
MTKIKRDPKAVALAQQIIKEYNPKNIQDMNDALKDLFGPIPKSICFSFALMIYFTMFAILTSFFI